MRSTVSSKKNPDTATPTLTDQLEARGFPLGDLTFGFKAPHQAMEDDPKFAPIMELAHACHGEPITQRLLTNYCAHLNKGVTLEQLNRDVAEAVRLGCGQMEKEYVSIAFALEKNLTFGP